MYSWLAIMIELLTGSAMVLVESSTTAYPVGHSSPAFCRHPWRSAERHGGLVLASYNFLDGRRNLALHVAA